MSDGTELYGESHLGEQAKAWVVVVHGYAEHSGRYQHVAKKLTDWGFNAFLYDHRGHGQSPGLLGYVPSMDQLCLDLCEIVMHVKSLAGSLPVYIVAHSMGTAVTIKAALENELPVAGYAFSGCLVKIPDDLSPILQKLAPVLAALVPKLPVGDAGGSKFLSTDPAVGEAFDADPLCYNGKVRARTGNEMLRTSRWIESRLEQWVHPVLLMHGKEDKLGEFAGSEMFFARAQSSDKTFVPFPDMEHEIFNEVEKAKVFDVLQAWLHDRAPA